MPDRSRPMRSTVRPLAAARPHTAPPPAATVHESVEDDLDGASFETVDNLIADPPAMPTAPQPPTPQRKPAPTKQGTTAAPRDSAPAQHHSPAPRREDPSALLDARLDEAWASHVPELAWIRDVRDQCVAAISDTSDFAAEITALRYVQLYCQWREMLCAAVHDAQHDQPRAGASELRAALLGELLQSLASLVDDTIVDDAQQLAGRILGAGFGPAA